MKDLSKTLKECPTCEAVVETIEYGVCEIVRRINPKIDPDFCRKTLRLRVEGKASVDEIARKLGVPKNELVKIVHEVTDFVDKEIVSKYLRRKK
ncbi:hypothetical protein DRO69_05780 [Candidatus Bathyarchaeota archaeon]|nr:MAG: hypothetical protein DRO69_05780 [Candidatus Bathyarchaeota archaeon]